MLICGEWQRRRMPVLTTRCVQLSLFLSSGCSRFSPGAFLWDSVLQELKDAADSFNGNKKRQIFTLLWKTVQALKFHDPAGEPIIKR